MLPKSVGLKVERANHHRIELLQALRAYQESAPFVIREDRRERAGLSYRVIVAHSLPVPDHVSLLLGDFVQNLRASLDYMVGALRRDGPSRQSAFPICRAPDGPSGFDNQSKTKLARISDEAKERIRAMQPYGSPGLVVEPYRALDGLHTLWNVDKHRSILVVEALVAPEFVGHNRLATEPSGIGFRFAPAGDEAEWWLPIDDRDQEFEPHFGVNVSLAAPQGFADDWLDWLEQWDIRGLVDYLYRTVRYQVLPQLEGFNTDSGA